MDISRGLDVLFTGARRFGCAFKRCGETQPSLRDDSSLEIRSGSVFGLSLADSVVADATRRIACDAVPGLERPGYIQCAANAAVRR